MTKNRPNTGNVSFSINMNELKTMMVTGHITYFIFYWIFIFLFVIFFFMIRFQVFESKGMRDDFVKNQIYNLTHPISSKFQLLQHLISNLQLKKWIGLTDPSYLFLFVLYSIAFLLLFRKMLGVSLFQQVFNLIQLNPNVNPYQNPRTVSKIPNSPTAESFSLYSQLLMISLLFVIPVAISFIVWKFGWTQLDIHKHTSYKFLIYGMLLLPPLLVILFTSRIQLYKRGEKYLEEKDKLYWSDLLSDLDKQFFAYYFVFFLCIFVLSLYFIVHCQICDAKYWIFSLLFLWILVPVAGYFLVSNILMKDFIDPMFCEKKGYSKDIQKALKLGVHNLYQATVKYNFPCFLK